MKQVNPVMVSLLRVVIGLPALAFIFLGLSWWMVPEFASFQLRMELLQGSGRTTQIADLASFFLTIGSCMLIGLLTRRPVWFFPAILLLGFAVLGRCIAWGFHGADLTLDMIIVELVVIALLLVASRSLNRA
ncbi:hypothetical protein [Aquisalinus flavus]|uniref:DUF4345 domain-containing protein n=1 Tax=Aquisalinus flavus TaxID=1526572 RepID=A0A8J2V2F8_9PROT|nr:hypothetical protein [Aquisalinus flavus]GGD02437.1 hypothetical protein GCM10011342_09320 [Aquisalinus flavus]